MRRLTQIGSVPGAVRHRTTGSISTTSGRSRPRRNADERDLRPTARAFDRTGRRTHCRSRTSSSWPRATALPVVVGTRIDPCPRRCANGPGCAGRWSCRLRGDHRLRRIRHLRGGPGGRPVDAGSPGAVSRMWDRRSTDRNSERGRGRGASRLALSGVLGGSAGAPRPALAISCATGSFHAFRLRVRWEPAET